MQCTDMCVCGMCVRVTLCVCVCFVLEVRFGNCLIHRRIAFLVSFEGFYSQLFGG